MVRWLKLWVSTAWGMGLVPGQGTKILDAKKIKTPKLIFEGNRSLPREDNI